MFPKHFSGAMDRMLFKSRIISFTYRHWWKILLGVPIFVLTFAKFYYDVIANFLR